MLYRKENTMTTTQRMTNATFALAKEIHVALERLDEIKHQVGYLDPERHTEGRVLGIKERIADLHTRLEGMKEFIESCQREASKTATLEEPDVWM